MQELLTALGKVQSELKAPKSQYNKFANFYYRSAEDILEAVKPLLFDNKLTMTISDDIINKGDRYYVQSTIRVAGFGEIACVTGVARESEDKKGMDSAQITGAASSYARKYALNGMFDIDDTKDADTQDNTKIPSERLVKPAQVKDQISDEQKLEITSLAKILKYTDNEIKAKISSISTGQLAQRTIDKLKTDVATAEFQGDM